MLPYTTGDPSQGTTPGINDAAVFRGE